MSNYTVNGEYLYTDTDEGFALVTETWGLIDLGTVDTAQIASQIDTVTGEWPDDVRYISYHDIPSDWL